MRDQINTAVWRAVTQTQEGLVNGTATVEIQQTVNAIINGNAAATPINGIPMTATPTPTPTFNETQVAAQLKTAVSAALTQTQDGLINQTATVAFQQTVEAVLHGIGTATAVAKRAALSQGLSPITAANARQLKSILTLQGKAGAIQDAVFDPTGAVIASVASDKTVRLWDTLTGNQLKQIPGLTNRTSLAFSSDGAYLAVASSDATVRVLNTTTGAEAAVLHEQPLTQGSVVGAIRSIAFSPNGQWLASGGDDKVVRLWRVSPGSAGQPTQFASDAQVLKGHFGAVNTVSFSPDSKVLVSGSQDASIILWEVSSGGQITILRDQQQVLSVAYNSDGTLLASGGTGRSIQVWDLSTGKSRIVLRWLNGITKTPSAINALAFGQDSSIIVGGGQDGPDIGVWDVAAGVNLAVLRGHTGLISSLVFSPDSVRLISGSADQTINVWGIPAK